MLVVIVNAPTRDLGTLSQPPRESSRRCPPGPRLLAASSLKALAIDHTWYIREATNDTNIKRSELDLYGLGPYTGHKSAFSRDASIMVMQCRTSKKIALYDVATGKLRLMKRPPGRG